jgi:hypothetical protein
MLTQKDPEMPEVLRCELLGGPLDGEVKFFPAPGPARLEFQTSDEQTFDGGSVGRSEIAVRTYVRVHRNYFLFEPLVEQSDWTGQ